MESCFFQQLQRLEEQKMHDDIIALGDLQLSIINNNPDVMDPLKKAQTFAIVADALFAQRIFKKALGYYRQAYQIQRTQKQSKCKTADGEPDPVAELQYNIHLCLVQLNQTLEALTVLESISTKRRDAKMSLALARLYRRHSNDRSAATWYKEVIRLCPMSFEAARQLLQLGTRGPELTQLIRAGLAASTGSDVIPDWMTALIQAEDAHVSREYSKSVSLLTSLTQQPDQANSTLALTSLGHSLYLAGRYRDAVEILGKVHRIDGFAWQHMDTLGVLLMNQAAEAEASKQLEQLATDLMTNLPERAEAWLCMSCFCFASTKYLKAKHFAKKAHDLDEHSAWAMHLLAVSLVALKKFGDALTYFREAIRLAPERFEPHQGLVLCYLDSVRDREALAAAAQVTKTLGTNARTLTLYGQAFSKAGNTAKARACLEQAARLDPAHTQCVLQLVNIYQEQQAQDKAIELLERAVQTHSCSKLHTELGNAFVKTNSFAQALHHYAVALSLNPMSFEARAARQHVQSLIEGGAGDGGSYAPQSGLQQNLAPEAPMHSDSEQSGSDTEAQSSFLLMS